jgi:hypothetical protein
MSNALKRDICDLKMAGVLIGEVERNRITSCLSMAVLYACRYWVNHLQRSEIGLCDDNGLVHIFLKEHFLHWLEALSLMGKISEGVLAITLLESIVIVSDIQRTFMETQTNRALRPTKIPICMHLFTIQNDLL